MKRFLLFSLICVSLPYSLFSQDNLMSPEAFLGYPLGSRYTAHHRLAAYFESAAKARPSKMKLEKYGETYEGRPLLLAFIASEENLPKLEQIRTNNLRLAGQSTDQVAGSEQTPAIVWLSYNVHGNEPSSSEAAMRTLHTLVSGSDPRVARWLENTIVIIDPCLNPDGRDRYVNWQNMASSRIPDPNPLTREHREPWPGGRTNHYYFDLNRDWAWQTQVESRQRMAVYNAWLPQVHVDFHEQGYNQPYYFAPAAEPYHEVITPWQREFQQLIGRNHARYFDEKGWFYFTREIFDLFYPSYGDTYPTYNGAIGMTYEQGGGPGGGKAVSTEDGDTLTLADRIEHHYVTGLSTVEVSSQNAKKLIGEFRKFFDQGVKQGSGSFSGYLIRGQQGRANLEPLLHYLKINRIQYGTLNSKNRQKAFSYSSGRDETIVPEADDLLIPARQPRAALVRVLFEPVSRLSDSATYDITAWSLPYALGLEAHALRDPVNMGSYQAPVKKTLADTGRNNPYAYVLPWDRYESAQWLARFLNEGIRVRYSEKPFTLAGREFGRGSLILPRPEGATENAQFKARLQRVAGKAPAASLPLIPVESGLVEKGLDFGSSSVRPIRAPKVAMLTGEGVSNNAAGEIWHFFEQDLQYPISQILATDIRRLGTASYDVLILPDGNYPFLNDKQSAEDLRNWVQRGGRLIAMENAVAQIALLEWGITKPKAEEPKKEGQKDTVINPPVYENRERDYLRNAIPGAIYRVSLDHTHPLAFGYPSWYYTLKQDGQIYELLGEGAWNVGYIRQDNHVSGFAGVKTKQKLKNGLLFGVQGMGRGQLIFLTDDPVFRGFWENGKLMLANAVFLVGQ